ncbi:Oidioi.mRNA.OKI2018_I69.XSR.g16898.t1.cds [Oikopleura dioica]|uniref:Oidioi.mRNA.OKI2018_I69.XSR.g16898.t1.cds n=1 Tax=Oikopleura dioica TaxID=34765 RepID=A0ABN7SNV7_OIKDI|nr:Oidioi.mRNA.OKI2018_I69.XSR.g16898.t1.cds [Oikopleura dioica]
MILQRELFLCDREGERKQKTKEEKRREGSQNENHLPFSYSAYPQMYFPVGQPQVVQPAGYHGHQMVHTGYDTRGCPTFTSMPNLAMPTSYAQPNVMPPGYPRLSTSMSHPHGLVMPHSTPPKQHPRSLSSETVAKRKETQPLPDCIVSTDQEMPTAIDMQELWRPGRKSSMTRLTKSFHDLSTKDKEWEGFRSPRGSHYF